MYCAFLDASKAFDKVLINRLVAKRIKRNAPVLLYGFYTVGLTN